MKEFICPFTLYHHGESLKIAPKDHDIIIIKYLTLQMIIFLEQSFLRDNAIADGGIEDLYDKTNQEHNELSEFEENV